MLQHIVYEAAERPDIDELKQTVVWIVMIVLGGRTEIAQVGVTFFVDEDIVGVQIAVHDTAAVQMFGRFCDACQHIEYKG